MATLGRVAPFVAPRHFPRFIGDIYPAREEPIPGVTSEIIFDKVTAPEKVLLKKEELMDYLAKEPLDVLVTFGAGNIDRFIGPITELLRKRL